MHLMRGERLKRGAWTTFALSAAVLAGCGSSDGTETRNAETAATVATSAAPKLAGNYARTVTRGDIERTDRLRKEGVGQAAPEPGRVSLALTDGALKFTDPRARLTIVQDFSATSDGAFRIGAYRRPELGSFCGPDVPQTATYGWALSDHVLTLKARQDSCADRDSLLTGAWRRR